MRRNPFSLQLSSPTKVQADKDTPKTQSPFPQQPCPRRGTTHRPRRGLCLRHTLALLLAAIAFSDRSLAAVITVDDSCSLVDAIHAANDNVAIGGCVAGGAGEDIVRLTETVELTRVDNENDGPNGLPVVRSEIRIRGHGSGITRFPFVDEFRLLDVAGTGKLTLFDTFLSAGLDGEGYENGLIRMSPGSQVDIVDSSLSLGRAENGGAIWNSGGTLTLFDTTVSDCRAETYGGMIFVEGPTASAFIASSSLARSFAWTGGGIRVQNGATLDLVESRVDFNEAISGGGVSVNGATAHVQRSSIRSNKATPLFFFGRGGGLAAFDSDVTIDGSTFYGNEGTHGSGIYASGFLSGLRISNSTIVWQDVGPSLTTETFPGSGLETESTYIWSDPTLGIRNCDGVTSQSSENLSNDATCPGFGHISEPGELGSDGQTDHMIIDPLSEAHDAGEMCGSAIDQRRYGRTDDACDSGSFELDALPPPTLALTGSCPGRVMLEVANATPNASVTLVRSPRIGRSEIPGGPCAGTEHLLETPIVVRSIPTDADGTATLQGNLNLALCSNLLQIVDTSTCLVSSVERHP